MAFLNREDSKIGIKSGAWCNWCIPNPLHSNQGLMPSLATNVGQKKYFVMM